MARLKKFIFVVSATALTNLALTIINILQAGSRSPDGRSVAEILGVDPRQATVADIEKLGRADTMQLFYAASTPDLASMHGEYQARVLKGGVLGPASILFTHHVFPTGTITLDTHWEGKAFQNDDAARGQGYNLFTVGGTGSARSILRARKFKTWIGPSLIGKDGRSSLHLDYSPFNTGVVNSMHDEVRQINDMLFICAGFMGLGGGPINPAPFVLMGPPDPWVGVKE